MLSNIGWISITFIQAIENWWKLGTLFHGIYQKFTVLNEVFLGLKLSVLTKFCLVLSRKWMKSFASHQYCRYLKESTKTFRCVLEMLLSILHGQGPSYTTFYVYNLWITVFVPGRLYLPSLMFVGKARSLS